MKLRCSPGCLAIVIKDTDPCRINLGRVVQVRGPVQVNPELGLPCWLVRPVTPAPYAVEYTDHVKIGRVFWKSHVEHPDAWLWPIRPELGGFGLLHGIEESEIYGVMRSAVSEDPLAGSGGSRIASEALCPRK